MKTTKIPVYGHIAVYIKYCVVRLKIDYTLRCLEYILFSIFTIKTPLALNCRDTDKCTLLQVWHINNKHSIC